MLQAIPHLAGFLLPPILVIGAQLGGLWTLLPVGMLLGGLPLADWMAGINARNVGERSTELSANVWFRAITWAWVPVHAAMLWWVLDATGAGRLHPFEIAGVAASTGIIGGTIGITFAHELVHRPSAFERALGEIVLSFSSYAHFAIEHVFGHHRYVATRRDPATARLGESLYAFLPRCVAGSIASAWRIEVDRLSRRGRGAWHPSNRMIRYLATQVVLYALIALRWGLPGVLFFAAQAIVSFSLLETINYIEHYGLERAETAPGRYERVSPRHSWNSSHRLSNWLLINLARHSDHHLTASKRYQVLDHREDAPQLPAGYGTMFLAAMVPPVWRRLMDPRVAQARRRIE